MADSRSRDRLWFGGLTVLVVVVVITARARASGLEAPAVHTQALAAGFDTMIGIGVTVMVAAGTLLLVSGSRVRKLKMAAAEPERQGAAEGKLFSWRLVAALLGGALLVLAFVVVSHPAQARILVPPSMGPLGLASPEGNVTAPIPGAQGDSGDPRKIVLITLLLLGVALIVVLLRRNTVIEEKHERDQEHAMVAAVEAGRRAVLDRRITTPREAIVACFAAMEHALAGRGDAVAPRISDTPSEVLERGIEGASLPAAPARTLLRLFREAQFSTHPMTDRDRGDADESLGELVRALETTTGARAAARGSQ